VFLIFILLIIIFIFCNDHHNCACTFLLIGGVSCERYLNYIQIYLCSIFLLNELRVPFVPFMIVIMIYNIYECAIHDCNYDIQYI
jgi:hypothetical protein